MQGGKVGQVSTAVEFRRERGEQPDRKRNRGETGGESGSGDANAWEYRPWNKEFHSEGFEAPIKRHSQHPESQVWISPPFFSLLARVLPVLLYLKNATPI